MSTELFDCGDCAAPTQTCGPLCNLHSCLLHFTCPYTHTHRLQASTLLWHSTFSGCALMVLPRSVWSAPFVMATCGLAMQAVRAWAPSRRLCRLSLVSLHGKTSAARMQLQRAKAPQFSFTASAATLPMAHPMQVSMQLQRRGKRRRCIHGHCSLCFS